MPRVAPVTSAALPTSRIRPVPACRRAVRARAAAVPHAGPAPGRPAARPAPAASASPTPSSPGVAAGPCSARACPFPASCAGGAPRATLRPPGAAPTGYQRPGRPGSRRPQGCRSAPRTPGTRSGGRAPGRAESSSPTTGSRWVRPPASSTYEEGAIGRRDEHPADHEVVAGAGPRQRPRPGPSPRGHRRPPHTPAQEPDGREVVQALQAPPLDVVALQVLRHGAHHLVRVAGRGARRDPEAANRARPDLDHRRQPLGRHRRDNLGHDAGAPELPAELEDARALLPRGQLPAGGRDEREAPLRVPVGAVGHGVRRRRREEGLPAKPHAEGEQQAQRRRHALPPSPLAARPDRSRRAAPLPRGRPERLAGDATPCCDARRSPRSSGGTRRGPSRPASARRGRAGSSSG